VEKMAEGKSKISKKEILELCREMERTASAANREKTQICFFAENPMNRVWIDARNLDWLADELDEPAAKKLRNVMAFNIDFEGPYYYYDY